MPRSARKPLLMVDIDGVVSLFGFRPDAAPEGTMRWIDGIPHFLSAAAARHLLTLGGVFELVWCSGWEERANEHLPHLLGLPGELPFLSFQRAGDETGAVAGAGAGAEAEAGAKSTRGHWKLDAIAAFAGSRPLAWIDDCIDAACHAWAAARTAPTLLVQTSPERGLTDAETAQLLRWASATG
jgi:HAD domain in Swiss Army Knife RNA repair proteins